MSTCKSDASIAKLTRDHLAILDHTEHRAARGLYCGDSPEIQELVRRGLMASAGRKSFVPDEYFRITAAGRETLAARQLKKIGERYP